MPTLDDNQGFYVYAHCLQDMTPFYIGKGRLCRAYDTSANRRNVRYNRTVDKFGRENVLVEIQKCLSEEEAFMRERMVISALRMSGVDLCNFTDGGEGTSGWKHPPEVIQKLSIASRGQIKTKETRAKISAVHKGKLISEQTRLRMSMAHTGVAKSKEAIAKSASTRKGIPRTEQQKLNIALGKLKSALLRGSE